MSCASFLGPGPSSGPAGAAAPFAPALPLLGDAGREGGLAADPGRDVDGVVGWEEGRGSPAASTQGRISGACRTHNRSPRQSRQQDQGNKVVRISQLAFYGKCKPHKLAEQHGRIQMAGA